MYFCKKNYGKDENVFVINEHLIDEKIAKKIIKNIKPNVRTGLDMKKVKTLNSRLFIQSLIDNKFKLYNLNSELMIYLSLILKDGKLHSYINFEDFSKDKREFIRRKFVVV